MVYLPAYSGRVSEKGERSIVNQPTDSSIIQRPPSLHILLVEDDDVDAEIVQRMLRLEGMKYPFRLACDGVEALQILRGEGGHEPMPHPYLILLDLNLPRMNGIEFLQVLRQDPTLKDSPVLVLTTSEQHRDKTAAYNQQIAGYFVKSQITEELVDIIKTFDSVDLAYTHE